MKTKLKNKKMCQNHESGYIMPRVYERASKGSKGPRVLVKCGCCDEKVEIYYDDETLEINGVLATIGDWEKILLPLLNIDADFNEED